MSIVYVSLLILFAISSFAASDEPTLLNHGLQNPGNRSCRVLKREVIRVQRGWPFAIRCGLPPFYYERAVTQCVLSNTETGEVLMRAQNPRDHVQKATLGYKNLHQDVNISMKVTDNTGKCNFMRFEVKVVRNLFPASCVNAVNANQTISVTASKASSAILECRIPKGTLVGYHQVNVTWFHNCSRIANDLSQADGAYLSIANVSMQNTGMYSCAVTINGATHFVSRHHLHIEDAEKDSTTTTRIACENKVVNALVGGDAFLQCTIHIEQQISRLPIMKWTKISSSSNLPITKCTNGPPNLQNGPTETISTSCNESSSALCCDNQVKNATTDVKNLTFIVARLNFRNLTAEDFGLYNLEIQTIEQMLISSSVYLLKNHLAVSESCVTLPSMKIQAIAGWPLFVPCNIPEQRKPNGLSGTNGRNKIGCLVYDITKGNLLLNVSETTSTSAHLLSTSGLDVTTKTLLTITKIGSRCWKRRMIVEKTQVDTQSCSSVLSGEKPLLYPSLEPMCFGSSNKRETTFQIKASWFRNCSVEILNNSTTSTPSVISEVKVFENHYVCALTYNGTTTYVGKYKVCGKDELDAPYLACNKTALRAEVGRPLTVVCTLTYDKINISSLYGSWSKTGGNLSDSCGYFNLASGGQEESSCRSVALDTCVANKSLERGFAPLEQRRISLLITNVTRNDGGTYKLMLTNQFGENVAQGEVTVALEKEPSEMEQSLAACTANPTMVLNAYKNWPFTVGCQVLESDLYYAGEEDYEYEDYYTPDIPAECKIWQNDTGKLLYHHAGTIGDLNSASLNVPDANELTPRRFLVVAKYSSNCWVQPIEVKMTELPQQTCEQAIAQSSNKRMHKTNIGGVMRLGCTGEYQHGVLDGTYNNQFNVTWLRNCSAVSEGSYRRMPGSTRPQLKIDRLTYEHPGVYTCAVTHNGQTHYVIHYPLCVKQQAQASRPLVKCTKKIVHGNLGSYVSVECNGDFGYSDISPITLTVKWSKIGTNKSMSLVCLKNMAGKTRHFDDNVTCNATLSKLPCFHHIPQGVERDPTNLRLKMSIDFENVKEKDFGRYVVTVSTSRSRTYSERSNATFDLVESQVEVKKNLTTQTNVIAACIGVFGFAIIVAAALFAYRRCKRTKPVTKYANHQFVHMELKNQISVKSKA